MRRHELTTVSLVHKATSVLEQANSASLHLDTDGTTKFQKKLEGAVINGMVLSVNEVPDGSADSILNDVSTCRAAKAQEGGSCFEDAQC